jgi:uncharacterized protein HemX
MTPDAVLLIVLSALGIAAVPVAVWLRAQKRIRHLEMTLLAQSTDGDRYDELRALLDRIAAQTEAIADMQAQLARRVAEQVDRLPPPRVEPSRPITPH